MNQEPKKILVVEDNENIRENIVEILELAGYAVHAADNGKNGIENAIAHQPALILCDVMMPILDGFGMLKILQQNPAINHIPLIFLTAKSEKTDIRKGMGLGADDYLTKPFDDTELLQVVEMRLAKSARLREHAGTENPASVFLSDQKAMAIMDELCDGSEKRRFSAKEEIFREGQQARWLYRVEEGQVKTYQENDYGKELTTALFGPKEYFGYHSLILDGVHENSASALTHCTVKLIPKSNFRDQLFGSLDLAAYFIKLFAAQAMEKEGKLIEMAYDSVRKKVSNALLMSASKQGTDKDHCVLSLSREELASLAGTAKETLIRTLSDLKSEGVIIVDGKNIEIPSMRALANIIR